ncbi:MAG: hypothetical protein IKT46_04060 [Clostridia bacterium]|nr:hypothetical protein [Clostridia bacterium]
MNENKVPTYGAVVSSIDYDTKLRRRLWFKKHGTKLFAACGAAVATALIIVALFVLI